MLLLTIELVGVQRSDVLISYSVCNGLGHLVDGLGRVMENGPMNNTAAAAAVLPQYTRVIDRDRQTDNIL